MISLSISITILEHKPRHNVTARARSFNKTDTATVAVIRIGTCHTIAGGISQDSVVVAGMDVGDFGRLAFHTAHDHSPFGRRVDPELTPFRWNRGFGERHLMRRDLKPVSVQIDDTAEHSALRDSVRGEFNRSASVKR